MNHEHQIFPPKKSFVSHSFVWMFEHVSMTHTSKPGLDDICLPYLCRTLLVGSMNLESNGRFCFGPYHWPAQCSIIDTWIYDAFPVWLVCGFDEARFFVGNLLSSLCYLNCVLLKTFSDFIQLILLTWIIIIEGISEFETQENDNKDRWWNRITLWGEELSCQGNQNNPWEESNS